jgi:hypothetical protein
MHWSRPRVVASHAAAALYGKVLTDMRQLLPLLLVALTPATCSHQAGHIVGNGKCKDHRVAAEAALQVLDAKGRTAEYVTERTKPRDEGTFWNIWIPRRALAFPGECLIRVQKSDCAAEWQPLK